MSDQIKNQATFSHPDAAPSGRSRSSSRLKPVAEARASAQRQELSEQVELSTAPVPHASKKVTGGMTVKGAIDAYI